MYRDKELDIDLRAHLVQDYCDYFVQQVPNCYWHIFFNQVLNFDMPEYFFQTAEPDSLSLHLVSRILLGAHAQHLPESLVKDCFVGIVFFGDGSDSLVRDLAKDICKNEGPFKDHSFFEGEIRHCGFMGGFLADPVSFIQRIVHSSEECLDILLLVLDHDAEMDDLQLVSERMLTLEDEL